MHVSSVCGVLLSVLLFLVLGGYLAYKVDILINKKGNELTLMEFKDFYSLEDKFTHADGLSLAFAVVTQESRVADKEPLDISYGHFNVTMV